jgi:Uma2 family endonuclease
MSTHVPRGIQEASYERWAREYLRSLPPEHFMEATAQATQREITMESLALVRAQRPEVHYFNELLVQYPRRGQRRPGQVVPDNMVVLSDQPIRASSSYNVPLEPERPFWVLEYVSKSNERKDYEDSFAKYERELKVPYYLVFYPDEGELTLYRHNRRKYVTVRPNEHGRYPVRGLDIEIGLLEGWVRYWYQGRLLPLPADLQRQLDEARRQAEEARRQADAARQEADAARQEADTARQEADAARQEADDEKRRADELRQRLEAAERELAELRARPRQRNG